MQSDSKLFNDAPRQGGFSLGYPYTNVGEQSQIEWNDST